MGTWIFPINNWIDFSNSILPVLMVLIVCMILCRVKIKRPTLWSSIFGILFSVAMVFGRQLDKNGSIMPGKPETWIQMLIFAGAMSVLTQSVWNWMQVAAFQKYTKKEKKIESVTIKTFWFAALLIFVCYFIVFLGEYPGFFVYDAQEEYMQVVTRNFTTHHPLVHVLLMGGLVHLGYKLTGSYNIGIAIYTIFQMAILSGVFGYFVWKLGKRGLPKAGRIILTLYLGLCPVLVMFSLCSAKDGLFAGMLLLMVLLLQDLFNEPEYFFDKKGKSICLAVTALGMMLLRHNGCYAFGISAICFLWFLYKKSSVEKRRVLLRKATMYFGGVLVVYFLVNQGFAKILHAQTGEHQEMLTVPIMQMARVYAYEKDSLSIEQQQKLEAYLPKEALLRYTPKVSDGVKAQFQNKVFEENPSAFFKLWLEIGAKHPVAYLNAWFMTSYGFWYPDTVIDVYRGNTVFTYTYKDSSYFGYEVELPGERNSRIPIIDKFYRNLSLEIFQQKIPIVAMLFSPGFFFWCLMFGLGFLMQGEYGEKAMPYLLPLLVWMTFLLGPTYLVRYVVYFWLVVPLLGVEICAILTRDLKKDLDNEKGSL